MGAEPKRTRREKLRRIPGAAMDETPFDKLVHEPLRLDQLRAEHRVEGPVRPVREGGDHPFPQRLETHAVALHPRLEVGKRLTRQQDQQPEPPDDDDHGEEDRQRPRHAAPNEPEHDRQAEDRQEEGQREGPQDGRGELESPHHHDTRRRHEQEPGAGVLIAAVEDHGTGQGVERSARARPGNDGWESGVAPPDRAG